MPIDTSRSGSPGQTFGRLAARLAALRPRYQTLDDYYTGEAACRTLQSQAEREAYRRLMHFARLNFAELIVEAVRARLQVDAFRTGADGDANGDQVAWRIWQANQLDADASLVHRMALTMGDAYVIVGAPDPELGGAPLISIEDPRYMVVEYDRARRRKATAGLKILRDETLGADVAYLYLLNGGTPFVLRAARTIDENSPFASTDGFEWIDQTRIPLTALPIAGFHNRQSDRSRGEFEQHLAHLDRINFVLLQRLEIATVQAFRQRAAKGGPKYDEQGNEINYSDVFTGAPGEIWHLPDGMELWESGQVDLGPVLQSIRDDAKDLATATQTPLFMFNPDAANGSAEGASLQKEGLVFKTEDRMAQFGESWEQTMSHSFAYLGDAARAARVDMEVVWAPAERTSLAQRADAAVKLVDILPRRTIRESILGYSPQEADRMDAEDQAQALLEPAPVTTPAGAPVPVGG